MPKLHVSINRCGVLRAISKNHFAVYDYLQNDKNSPKALKYLVGCVMRETKGKADPEWAKEEITKILGVN